MPGRHPFERGGPQLKQFLDRRGPHRLDEQAANLAVDLCLQGEREQLLAGPIEQVVVEPVIELGPRENHEPHAPSDEAGQLGRLLGRGRGDVREDEDVGRFEPGGEEILLLHRLDPPGFGVADPDRERGGEVVNLGAERFRRRLAVHQADQERILHRDRGPLLVVPRQLVLGELKRNVVRPAAGKADRQRHLRGLPRRDLREGQLDRPVVHPEDRLGPRDHAWGGVADQGFPAALRSRQDCPVERDQGFQSDVRHLVGSDVDDADVQPLLIPAACDRRDACFPACFSQVGDDRELPGGVCARLEDSVDPFQHGRPGGVGLGLGDREGVPRQFLPASPFDFQEDRGARG